MRFYIDTKDLNAGISTVIKALSSRTTIGILEGVYVSVKEDGIHLKCTDLSLQIETTLAATVEEEGSLVLPGRIFSEMAKRLPGETTEIHTEGNTAYIDSGRAKTTLQGMDAADYPDMPRFGFNQSFEIGQVALKNMIRQSIFAIAQDDTKPILTGVLMQAEGETLSLVALDGYRLAMTKARLDSACEHIKVVVPGKSLSEVTRILSDDDEAKVKLTLSRTHMVLDMGYTIIITRLLDGEFIKYDQILPADHATLVRINRQEFLDGIERASLMAREGKNNLVKLSFTSDIVAISANSELGRINEDVSADITGSDIDIAFNSRYVSDVLKSVEDEEIYLEFNNNISPCVIKPVQGNRYYYLILPVRLFAGG